MSEETKKEERDEPWNRYEAARYSFVQKLWSR
jgi:hypothetical protein